MTRDELINALADLDDIERDEVVTAARERAASYWEDDDDDDPSTHDVGCTCIFCIPGA
jgi:hypothetical protein